MLRVDKEETGACVGFGIWELVTQMGMSAERWGGGRPGGGWGHSPRRGTPEGPRGDSRGQGQRLGASLLAAARSSGGESGSAEGRGSGSSRDRKTAGPGTKCVTNGRSTVPEPRHRRRKGVALDSGHSRLQTRKQMPNVQRDPDGASTRAGRGLHSSQGRQARRGVLEGRRAGTRP